MPIIKICDACGIAYRTKPCYINLERGCSPECGRELRLRRLLAARPKLLQPEGHRLIPASNGAVIKVSTEDYDYLSRFLWQVPSSHYATDTKGLMHLQIMSRAGIDVTGKDVDHINRDKLDNRRSNLRLATRSQNCYNRVKGRTERSIYKGVQNRGTRWNATIWHNQKFIWIGSFDDEDSAAWMVDQWSIELHGDFAVLNHEYV